MQGLDSTAGIVAIVAAVLAPAAVLPATAALLRLRRLNSAQAAVLGDSSSADLIAHGIETRQRAEQLRVGVGALQQGLVYAKPPAGRGSELELSPKEHEAIRLAEESAGK